MVEINQEVIPYEKEVLKILEETTQTGILAKYPSLSINEKKSFISQVYSVNESLLPGGLKYYIERAKTLLVQTKSEYSEYENYKVSPPKGTHLTVGNDEFFEYEKLGIKQLKNVCFVLVAGGIGERLGCDKIKISIITELIELKSFIKIYTEHILGYEKKVKEYFKSNKDKDPSFNPDTFYIPFCIMTSDLTHDKTIELFKEKNNFGLKNEQIIFMKQGTCPGFKDINGNLALAKDKFLLELKPHGHGDVHLLLYHRGIVQKWIEMKKKYLIIFQDTNALAFNSVASSLGVSEKNNLILNQICIPIKKGDNVSVICQFSLRDEFFDENKKINFEKLKGNQPTFQYKLPVFDAAVEYNETEKIVKKLYNPDGLQNNPKTGYIDFPGITNILIYELKGYLKALKQVNGLIPEKAYPKFVDKEKTILKSSFRLESYMQHFSSVIEEQDQVGYTLYDKWFCFTTCKNNLTTGIERLKKGIMPECAFSCEQEIYNCSVRLLKDIFNKLEIVNPKDGQPEEEMSVNLNGLTIKFGPRIIISPIFAPTITDLKEKLEKMDGKIKMTINSTLILNNDVNILKGIYIDGNLNLDKNVDSCLDYITKERVIYIPLKENQGLDYEKIRGYTSIVKSSI